MIAQIDLKPEDLLQEHLAEGLFTPKRILYPQKKSLDFLNFLRFFGFFGIFFGFFWVYEDIMNKK